MYNNILSSFKFQQSVAKVTLNFNVFTLHNLHLFQSLFPIYMRLTITGSKETIVVQIDGDTTVEDLYLALNKTLKIPQNQIAVYVGMPGGEKKVIDQMKSRLVELGVTSDSLMQVKNLGKQIKWEYVFYIQYLGPIIIIPALYYMGHRGLYTLVQPFAAIMGVTHYLKRELETAFVHVFSRKTMPFKRVFINSAHYWVLFALFNGIELFMFPKKTSWDTNDIMILFFVWATLQFCNFKCHLELSGFRKKGKNEQGNEDKRKARGIPQTYGFRYVSCANYLWETLGWVTFSLLTRCYTSYIFTAVSFAQMADWALKKHRAYRKQFGENYPKNRKAIVPFLL